MNYISSSVPYAAARPHHDHHFSTSTRLGGVLMLIALLALGAAFQFWIAFVLTALVTFLFGYLSRAPPTFKS